MQVDESEEESSEEESSDEEPAKPAAVKKAAAAKADDSDEEDSDEEDSDEEVPTATIAEHKPTRKAGKEANKKIQAVDTVSVHSAWVSASYQKLGKVITA